MEEGVKDLPNPIKLRMPIEGKPVGRRVMRFVGKRETAQIIG